MGFERRIYTFNKKIIEDASDEEINYDRIRAFFGNYGIIKEFNFSRKLIKLSSSELELSFIMGQNRITVTFRKKIRKDFEKNLKIV